MVTPQPGQTFGNLGIGGDTVAVPETRTYLSEDKTQSRRFIAGDVVSLADAELFGMIPETTGEPLAAPDAMGTEAAIAHLRALGYQVAPMAVTGPMDPPPTEAVVAQVQEQGFEVQKPGEVEPGTPTAAVVDALFAAADPATTEASTDVNDPTRDELTAKKAAKAAAADAKATKPNETKVEAAPETKVDGAPATKSE